MLYLMGFHPQRDHPTGQHQILVLLSRFYFLLLSCCWLIEVSWKTLNKFSTIPIILDWHKSSVNSFFLINRVLLKVIFVNPPKKWCTLYQLFSTIYFSNFFNMKEGVSIFFGLSLKWALFPPLFQAFTLLLKSTC